MSDKPGTGKTYVILSLILSNLNIGPNIIVVPQNVFDQWDLEINKFCDLNKIKYYKLNTYNDTMLMFSNPKIIADWDIILVTPLYYYQLTSSIIRLRMVIGRVFYDEIDTIDTLLKEPLPCTFTWFVSASFRDNKIGCYEMNPNDICERTCNIGRELVLPIMNSQIIECSSSYIDLLYGIVSDEKINQLNGLDFRIDIKFFEYNKSNKFNQLDFFILVVKELNDKQENYAIQLEDLNNSINKILSDTKINKHEKNRRIDVINKELVIINNKININKQHILKLSNKLKLNLYTNNEIFDINKIETVDINQIETIDINQIETININQIETIDINQINTNLIKPNTDKLEMFKTTFNKIYQPNKKIIIFSNYSNGLNFINQFLETNKIPTTNLEGGNSDDIAKSLEDFKYKNYSVLVVNTFGYACGMNLEFVTDIFLIHKLESQLENQVIGRAQRYGRTSELNIYKFLNDNEQL
jgi:hypothetical protein